MGILETRSGSTQADLELFEKIAKINNFKKSSE